MSPILHTSEPFYRDDTYLHDTDEAVYAAFLRLDVEDAIAGSVMLVSDSGRFKFHAEISEDWAKWVAWQVIYEQDRAVSDFKRGKTAAKARVVGALMDALGRRVEWSVCNRIIDRELAEVG